MLRIADERRTPDKYQRDLKEPRFSGVENYFLYCMVFFNAVYPNKCLLFAFSTGTRVPRYVEYGLHQIDSSRKHRLSLDIV